MVPIGYNTSTIQTSYAAKKSIKYILIFKSNIVENLVSLFFFIWQYVDYAHVKYFELINLERLTFVYFVFLSIPIT